MAMRAMPIQHTTALLVAASSAMPAIMTHVAMRDEKLTMGTSAERIARGA